MSIIESDSSKPGRRARPEQYVRLTPSLVVALWQRNEQGQSRVSWSLDRHNAADPTAPFRMCQEQDVLELGLFAERLAMALARKESLPKSLRKKLAAFAAAQAQVNELLQEVGNGKDDSEEPEGNRVLSFE